MYKNQPIETYRNSSESIQVLARKCTTLKSFGIIKPMNRQGGVNDEMIRNVYKNKATEGKRLQSESNGEDAAHTPDYGKKVLRKECG